MGLARIFQISIYGSAAMAGLMLGMAEGASMPAALTAGVALVALVFIEGGLVRGTPGIISNLLGLAAFGVATSEFLGGERIESRLLSGAHLLVYLQWIVLLQAKTRRQYWAMCALALLQVAVGSVLTESSRYGVLLILFLLLQVWTLTIFSLHEARTRFVARTDRWLKHSLQVATDDGAWGQASSIGRDNIQIDAGERWVNSRLIGTVLATAFMSLMVSSAVFAFTPRLWLKADLSDGGTPALAVTGISNEVRLGDMGQITESAERVMTVRLVDNDSSKPIDLQTYAVAMGLDEPYFRGGCMWRYDSGRWVAASRLSRMVRLPEMPTERGMVRQEVELQPCDSAFLFCMHPIFQIDVAKRSNNSAPLVRIWRADGAVNRPPTRVDEAVKYSVISPRTGTTQPAYSPLGTLEGKAARSLFLGVPRDGLKRLQQLAAKVARSSADSRPDAAVVAKRLVAHFTGGTYGYTLNASIQDPNIDPLEDFLFNRKEGHCDYFASALTLMLRSQNVPARVVIGFKGGSVNSLNDAFEVQQRHAHAWVEAYYNDRWNLLDSTPAGARQDLVEKSEPQFKVLNEVGTSLDDLWDRFVVGVSFENQENSIYKPLLAAISDWAPGDKSDSWSRRLMSLMKDPRKWFSWQGGVFTFILALLGALLYRLHPIRRLVQLLRRFGIDLKPAAPTRSMVVEFYDRFHRLCESHQLVRGNGQTQAEFAGAVTDRWRTRLESSNLLSAPAKITQFFYDVRFGDRQLSTGQLADIDSQLTALENCLGSKSHGAA